MNVTLPPPLPDVPPRSAGGPPPLPAFEPVAVPFARLAAPVPAPPFAARAPRILAPVQRSTRLFLHAALPLVLLASLLLLMKQYGSGTHFRHAATHRMIRGFDLMVFVAVCGLGLMPIAITYCCIVHRLRRRDRWTAALRLVLSVAAAWAAVASSEAVFRRGKARAYASVNVAALAADAAAMVAAPRGFVGANGESVYLGNDPFVPAYTRSLKPSSVYVSPAGVRVVMASEMISNINPEGWFVPVAPLGMTPQAYGAQTKQELVSVQPPVFRHGAR